MSQTMSNIPSAAGGALPRPSRPRKAPQIRLQPQDFAWMALAAAISLTISALKSGLPILATFSSYAAAATTAAVYLLGFCARDRVTALTGGLLMAVSASFIQQAPADTVFTFLALLALAAHVAQKPLAGLVIAGLAIAARIDSILLGLVLIALLLPDKNHRPGILLSTFAASALASTLGLFAVQHHFPPMPQWHPNIVALLFFFTGGAAIIGWLALPFLADLAEPARLTRWKPVLIWTCVAMLIACCAIAGDTAPYLFIEPFMIVLAAAGFARILPVIASDSVKPRIRYILAIAAAIAIAAPKAHLDWTTTHPAVLALKTAASAETKHELPSKKPEAPKVTAKPAHSSATPTPSVPKRVVTVTPPPAKKPAAPPAPAADAPAAIVAQALKMGVPITHKDWRGRTLPRNVWAIQWDIKKRQEALAAKGAPHKP